MNVENIFKEVLFFMFWMNKELKILKIMKEKKCSWSEAVIEEEKRKSLTEFF